MGPLDLSDALSEGFSENTAEKVHRLLSMLRAIQDRRSTRGRFILKGGTALNIFHSRNIPRLSVDLDLMVVGFPGVRAGPQGHARVLEEITGLVKSLGYSQTTADTAAAATVRCRYRNRQGSIDQVKIDLDLLNRVTLLSPVSLEGPALFGAGDYRFPVVDVAELLGQKLTAAAYRAHPRDLFDMHVMLRQEWHLRPHAREMYLAYSFLQDADWRRLDYPTRLNVDYRASLLEDVLRLGESAPSLSEIRRAARLALASTDPPFNRATPAEESMRMALLAGDTLAFPNLVGEVRPSRRRLLSKHPGLRWRLLQASGPSRDPGPSS